MSQDIDVNTITITISVIINNNTSTSINVNTSNNKRRSISMTASIIIIIVIVIIVLGYTQFPISYFGIIGPNPWKFLAQIVYWVSGQPNPWNKYFIGFVCDGNWVYRPQNQLRRVEDVEGRLDHHEVEAVL